ncbi:MAG: GNAT family N-acetyltransferase [Muriicola sp.]|nr:GNAT family N-acetyltransferase [Muriicola sp.]
MKDYLSFETERLNMIPTSKEDATFIYELMNSPKWIKFIGDRKIRTVKDAEEYIDMRMRPQLERVGFSVYTLVRKSDQAKIGICCLIDREELEGIDLGYALLPDHEGAGYAQEASEKMIAVGFEEFGLPNLYAITNPTNKASQKLLQKLGFISIGDLQLVDEKIPDRLYELKSNWK